MTEHEFQAELLPVLAGIWPRMVAKTRANATDFDRKAAREANRHIYAVLGQFEASAAIQAARDYGAEHPGSPQYQDYGRILNGIRHLIQGDRREFVDDPARWTWQDECSLGHALAAYKPSVDAGKLSKSYAEPLWVARHMIGKNPTAFERQEAREILKKHCAGVRERLKERGRTQAEADALSPDPWW